MMEILAWFCLITFAFTFGVELDEILLSGINEEVYPGIVALAGNEFGEFYYQNSFGTFEYLKNNSNSPNVEINSIFDIASLSKVTATTNAVGLLYQLGYISVLENVAKYLGDDFARFGKGDVKVLNCLLHNAGFNPDPEPGYYAKDFNCSNTANYYPVEDFSCVERVYSSLMNETLAFSPGEVYAYSDLSFITLQFVVGAVVFQNNIVEQADILDQCTNSSYAVLLNCYFEAFIRKRVFHSGVWLNVTGYLLPQSLQTQALPTTLDTSYRHTLNQGNVSDSNCYAMGGVCGHAGIFSTGPELAKLATRLLVLASTSVDEEKEGPIYPGWLNSTTVRYFTQEYNASQSSRALGWTTNDASVADYGFSGSCGTMSRATFMHIGYTGTCICIDPVHRAWSVILTNRVYNMGSSDAVKAIYQQFNTELMAQIASSRSRRTPFLISY